MYDGEADAIESFLKPEYQYSGCSTRTTTSWLLHFGEDARVLGFDYDDAALDVRVGMRPDLTGHGKGVGFARAVLDFARRTYAPDAYRVTIATFNRRARQLCLARFRRKGASPGPIRRAPAWSSSSFDG
jgi:[ribosomal protein S18]-alanine N-acetyltransferase